MTLSSCVKTSVSEYAIQDLKYITVETARLTKADSIVIVKEGHIDYVFVKHINGDITLKAQYISDTRFLCMPIAFFVWILLVAFVAGLLVEFVIIDRRL